MIVRLRIDGRYGRKDVKAIADHVETRNATQVSAIYGLRML